MRWNDTGLPTGPDLEVPEAEFRDGDHLFEVSVTPAALPVRYLHGHSGDLVSDLVVAVAAGLVGVASRVVDRRSKVTVARTRARPFSLWRTVDVEFFDTRAEAEAHQLALVSAWDRDRYSTQGRVGALEMSQRRRKSRSGRSVDV